jgi:hypothetical protein
MTVEKKGGTWGPLECIPVILFIQDVFEVEAFLVTRGT